MTDGKTTQHNKNSGKEREEREEKREKQKLSFPFL